MHVSVQAGIKIAADFESVIKKLKSSYFGANERQFQKMDPDFSVFSCYFAVKTKARAESFRYRRLHMQWESLQV